MTQSWGFFLDTGDPLINDYNTLAQLTGTQWGRRVSVTLLTRNLNLFLDILKNKNACNVEVNKIQPKKKMG